MIEGGARGYVRDRDRGGVVIIVTSVIAGAGSKAAAAALACAGSEPDRAALLIDLDKGRAPRSSLIASAAARELEERLAAHLPEAGVASRGRHCRLRPATDPGDFDGAAKALPLARDSVAVIHLPPGLLRPALEDPRIRATGVMLCADLAVHRPLVALAAGDLIGHGLRVAVLKQPLGRLSAYGAMIGALTGHRMPPEGACRRLLQAPSG